MIHLRGDKTIKTPTPNSDYYESQGSGHLWKEEGGWVGEESRGCCKVLFCDLDGGYKDVCLLIIKLNIWFGWLFYICVLLCDL